jgi:hypothetical protein
VSTASRIERLEREIDARTAETESLREVVNMLRRDRDADRERMRQLDLVYQDTAGKLATVRLALEAPNPCDLVEWALKVKKKAGPMADDMYAQQKA